MVAFTHKESMTDKDEKPKETKFMCIYLGQHFQIFLLRSVCLKIVFREAGLV